MSWGQVALLLDRNMDFLSSSCKLKRGILASNCTTIPLLSHESARDCMRRANVTCLCLQLCVKFLPSLLVIPPDFACDGHDLKLLLQTCSYNHHDKCHMQWLSRCNDLPGKDLLMALEQVARPCLPAWCEPSSHFVADMLGPYPLQLMTSCLEGHWHQLHPLWPHLLSLQMGSKATVSPVHGCTEAAHQQQLC